MICIFPAILYGIQASDEESTLNTNSTNLPLILNLNDTKIGVDINKIPRSTSKIAYIDNLSSKNLKQTFYIGQSIKVIYSLLLLDSSQLVDTKIHPFSEEDMTLLNQDSINWKIQEDGTYQATFIYKILSNKAYIPQIDVTVLASDQKSKDIAVSPRISLDIYNLKNNPKYCGVIADKINILHIKTRSFDETQAISILEIEALNSNLEDFSIPMAQSHNQGFQTQPKNIALQENQQKKSNADEVLNEQNVNKDQSKDDGTLKRGIYYIVFPKSLSEINFEFFSLKDNQFHSISVPIVITHDSIATQDTLKPKNIFLLYSTLFLILGILICLTLYLLVWRHKILIVLSILLLAILLWHIFYRHKIELKENQEVKILPTNNSTTLFISKFPIEVQVIGSHGNFYKIQTPNGQIGWIKKE